VTRILDVTVRVAPIEAMADRVGRAVERLASATDAIDAVNLVTAKYDEVLRAGMIADINLSDAYVRSKTDLAFALRNPEASITVRGDLTILGHYPRTQLTQAAGKRSRGDPSRGIPAGSKQAGLSVGIKRSTPTVQPKWFSMKLRRGTQAGDKVGVFVRVGPGRKDVRHIYGPSPYSLFRFQASKHLDQIAEELQAEVGRSVEQAL